MGSFCSKEVIGQDPEETDQDLRIARMIEKEKKMESSVKKLLLLGAGESGKSTFFKQVKVLFANGLQEEPELKDYVKVIHANVYQAIKVLGQKLSEIGDKPMSELPQLDETLAQEIDRVWKDPAIQATYARASELPLADCTNHFLDNVLRLAGTTYIPTMEDIMFARVKTTGVAEIEFSLKGKGERYRLVDVGGQRNERKKWIHLFDDVTAVIFCAALSEYDQTLYEDETKNRMMETKELFEWILQEPSFKKSAFLLFLNKFDLFEKKVRTVPLTVCEWFQDYVPRSPGNKKDEVDHAYRYIEGKFKEVYARHISSTTLKVFQTFKTTAVDRQLVKSTFDHVEKALDIKRLEGAGLL